MFTPRIVFTLVVGALMIELLIWKSSAPTSFARRFDPVHQKDIQFEPKQFDLGNVAPGNEQSLSVAVTNLKERSVVLQQPQSTCGCIRFKIDQPLELAPNESTVLSLVYKAPRVPGEVVKSVLLRVASAESTWRIPFRCNVVADAWSDPQDLELVTSDGTATTQGLVHFVDGKSVVGVLCSHPEMMQVELEPQTKKTQPFSITVNSDAGEGYVAFLDSNADHLVTIPVTWRTPRWMECFPAKVTLSPTLERDESYEIVVLRNPNKTKTLELESQVPWITVSRQWSVSEKVERFVIDVDAKITPRSFSGPIVRISDSSSGQSVELAGKI